MSYPQLSISKRQIAHVKIRELMNRNELGAAVELADTTLEIEGPHVGLLCEKAACEYELGQYQNCEITFYQIEYELKIAKDLISKESALKTYIFLAKFSEEFGEYKKALDYLELTLQSSQTSTEKKWVLLQELRILSYIGQIKGLSAKFLALEDRHIISTNLDIETLHSLMWAEWRIFGWSHAEARYKQLQTIELNALDERLITRDFLEISILSNQLENPNVQSAIQKLKKMELLDYDHALISVIAGEKYRITNISKMMKLRTILLAIHLEKNDTVKFELKRKYIFILESVSQKSREMLMGLLSPASSDDIQILSVNKISMIAVLNTRQIRLTKLQLKILEIFTEQQKIELSDLSLKLLNIEMNDGTYDRIRMLVYRTNKLFESCVGFKIFDITKNSVDLDARAKICLA